MYRFPHQYLASALAEAKRRYDYNYDPEELYRIEKDNIRRRERLKIRAALKKLRE